MIDPTTDHPGPGALAGLARDHTSRKRFLRMGGAGLAGALAMAMTACGSDEEVPADELDTPQAAKVAQPDPGLRRFGSGDLAIANYALTLEFIETDFYEKVIESGLLPAAAIDMAKRFGEQERTHVEALTKLIEGAGGTPVERPKTQFELEGQRAVVELAATIEDLGANAYLAQAPRIKDEEILAAALSIHSVEARHAAALADLAGKPALHGAFSKPADASTVLAAVRPFIASEES